MAHARSHSQWDRARPRARPRTLSRLQIPGSSSHRCVCVCGGGNGQKGYPFSAHGTPALPPSLTLGLRSLEIPRDLTTKPLLVPPVFHLSFPLPLASRTMDCKLCVLLSPTECLLKTQIPGVLLPEILILSVWGGSQESIDTYIMYKSLF